MKIKTKTVYINQYIAEDGTEFANEQQCIDYENGLHTSAEIAADLVPHVIYCRDWFDAFAVDSDLVAIFYPRDLADTEAVCKWADQHSIRVPENLANDTKPILFSLHGYKYHVDEDDNSLFRVEDVWDCLGSPDDMISEYAHSILCMMESGAKEAKPIHHDNALSK